MYLTNENSDGTFLNIFLLETGDSYIEQYDQPWQPSLVSVETVDQP